jgi:class 3 adenylate cyclase
MPERSRETVTFLFTDIEGSTTLLQTLRDEYPNAVHEHRRLLSEAVEHAESSTPLSGTKSPLCSAAVPRP